MGGADEDLLPGQLLLENLITGGYIVHVLHSLSGILYNLFPVLYFLSGILYFLYPCLPFSLRYFVLLVFLSYKCPMVCTLV